MPWLNGHHLNVRDARVENDGRLLNQLKIEKINFGGKNDEEALFCHRPCLKRLHHADSWVSKIKKPANYLKKEDMLVHCNSPIKRLTKGEAQALHAANISHIVQPPQQPRKCNRRLNDAFVRFEVRFSWSRTQKHALAVNLLLGWRHFLTCNKINNKFLLNRLIHDVRFWWTRQKKSAMVLRENMREKQVYGWLAVPNFEKPSICNGEWKREEKLPQWAFRVKTE